MIEQINRPLPSAPEAERVIVGAPILDPAIIDEAIDMGLLPEHFYSPRNASVYEVLVHLRTNNLKIDPIMIGEELKKKGTLISMGGVAE